MVHFQKLSIDAKTGEITLKTHLDWESEPLISMYLSVSDGNGRSAVVPLKIVVEPVDEFAPVFTKSSYTLQVKAENKISSFLMIVYQIPISTPAGDSVGQMQAIDEDGGPHGIVKYAISDRQNTVSIEEDTGIVSCLFLPSLPTVPIPDPSSQIALPTSQPHNRTDYCSGFQ